MKLFHGILILLHSFLKVSKFFWLYHKITAFYSRKSNRSQDFWELSKKLCNKIDHLQQNPDFSQPLKLLISKYWATFKYKIIYMRP